MAKGVKGFQRCQRVSKGVKCAKIDYHRIVFEGCQRVSNVPN